MMGRVLEWHWVSRLVCAKLYKRMFGSNLLASPLLNLGMSVVMLYLSSHGSGYSDYDKSAFVLYGNFKYI